MCVCAQVHVHACVVCMPRGCACLGMPEEGVRYFGAGVIGICDLLGTELGPYRRTVGTLNGGAISQP